MQSLFPRAALPAPPARCDRPPERPGARRRHAQHGLDRQGRMQSGRVEGWTGGPLGEGIGKGSGGRRGGKISNGIANAQRCATHLQWAHVAPETTRDVVGLGDPVERCLANTSRCNGRWTRGQLEMTQDARDHRFLGHGGNDPERAASAQGKVARLPPPTQWRKTGGHSQSKHMPQEPGPAPGRGPVCASSPSTPCGAASG